MDGGLVDGGLADGGLAELDLSRALVKDLLRRLTRKST